MIAPRRRENSGERLSKGEKVLNAKRNHIYIDNRRAFYCQVFGGEIKSRSREINFAFELFNQYQTGNLSIQFADKTVAIAETLC